ncbi:hypothetical protein D3C80_2012830 [compost metagenome]
MLAGNRQLAVAVIQQAAAQYACVYLEVVPAQSALDGNFPEAGGTEKQFVFRIFKQGTGWR